MSRVRTALWMTGAAVAAAAVVTVAVPGLQEALGLRPSSARGRAAEAALPEVAEGPPEAVAALGRIEPLHGVRRLAGPPRPAVVIGELLVEEGDRVVEGQPVARLAERAVQRAEVARLEAELATAERELERNRRLRRDSVLSDTEWDALLLRRDVARAALERARAELGLSTVRSPLDGQVLEIHAREGERVGGEGIAELGQTAAMVAVAEVYETDIGRVRVGQRARVRSPALPHALEGVVDRIGLKIGKKDVLSTDPVADADARVVEVEIRLLEPELAAALTNLRVEVLIGPE